ncbi:MAG: hypothetical protein RJB62_709 [Pseudomonadota bacterium]|jgi:hypothetical protein
MTTSSLRVFASRVLLGAFLFGALGAAEEDGLPFSPALPPPMGRIDIETTGADGAQIYVDGELSGTTPEIVTVDSGERVIVLKKDGFADFEQRLTIAPLETQTLHVEMVRP